MMRVLTGGADGRRSGPNDGVRKAAGKQATAWLDAAPWLLGSQKKGGKEPCGPSPCLRSEWAVVGVEIEVDTGGDMGGSGVVGKVEIIRHLPCDGVDDPVDEFLCQSIIVAFVDGDETGFLVLDDVLVEEAVLGPDRCRAIGCVISGLIENGDGLNGKC